MAKNKPSHKVKRGHAFAFDFLPLAPIYTPIPMADDLEAPAHRTANNSNNRTSSSHGIGRIYLNAVLFFIWAFAVISVGVGESLNGPTVNERPYVSYRSPCMGQIASTKEGRQSGRSRTNGRQHQHPWYIHAPFFHFCSLTNELLFRCGPRRNRRHYSLRYNSRPALLLFLKHTRFFLAQSIGLALCAIWIFAGLVVRNLR